MGHLLVDAGLQTIVVAIPTAKNYVYWSVHVNVIWVYRRVARRTRASQASYSVERYAVREGPRNRAHVADGDDGARVDLTLHRKVEVGDPRISRFKWIHGSAAWCVDWFKSGSCRKVHRRWIAVERVRIGNRSPCRDIGERFREARIDHRHRIARAGYAIDRRYRERR